MRLLSIPYYTAKPLYWTMSRAPHSWDELMHSTGQQFVWPVIYKWLGILKIGLLNEGLDTAEELYEAIFGCYQAASSYIMKQPVAFLIFTHLGNGKFRVWCKKNLLLVYTTIFNRKKIGQSVSFNHVNVNCQDLERKWDFLVRSFNSIGCTVPSIPISSSPYRVIICSNMKNFSNSKNHSSVITSIREPGIATLC